MMHTVMNLRVSEADILISNYAKSLSESDKQRYVEKLKNTISQWNLEDPCFTKSS